MHLKYLMIDSNYLMKHKQEINDGCNHDPPKGPPHASEVKGASVALLIYKKRDLMRQVDFYVKTYRRRNFAMPEM